MENLKDVKEGDVFVILQGVLKTPLLYKEDGWIFRLGRVSTMGRIGWDRITTWEGFVQTQGGDQMVQTINMQPTIDIHSPRDDARRRAEKTAGGF